MFSASPASLLSPLQVLSDNFSPLNLSLGLHSTNLSLLSRRNPWSFPQRQGEAVAQSRYTVKHNWKKHTREKGVKTTKKTSMHFCCVLCDLLKACPEFWSEPNWLAFCTAICFKLGITSQFGAAWANSGHLWMRTALTACWNSTGSGRLAGETAKAQEASQASQKNAANDLPWWEHSSPFPRIHREHHSQPQGYLYLEPTINSGWMQAPVWKQMHFRHEL